MQNRTAIQSNSAGHNGIPSPSAPGAWLRGVFFLLAMQLPSVVSAQILLIELDPVTSQALNPPAAVAPPVAVVLPRVRLDELRLGEEFYVQLAEGTQLTLQIRELEYYLNGDLGLSAHGRQGTETYSMTLTAGPQSLYGHASAGGKVWQVQAIAEGDSYRGWIYQPQSLLQNTSSLQNDYVIPGSSFPTAVTQSRPISPLLTNGQDYKLFENQSASAADIDADNLRITQVFNPDPVIVGAETEAQILVENISAESHSGLSLEIYFLLEDSELVSADPACSVEPSLSLQPILLCQIGELAAGETSNLNLVLRASEASQPYLSSSILIGNLRHDQFINVVLDVSTDSDADGISDFNEELIGTDPTDASSVSFETSTIDVMALFTAGAELAYPFGVETRINQLIGVANQVYRDSGVGITLRPVHHQRVEYNDEDDMDTALDNLMQNGHPAFSAVPELRERYGADLVMLFRPLEASADRCGLAPIGGYKTNGYMNPDLERGFAYSHIGIDCPIDIVVAHELGHNMGLSHSHLEDGYGGTFNYATGFGLDGQFATVMAYPGAFNTETRVSRFSDPLAQCLGFACGVDSALAQGADAVRALNLVRHQIANYYPSTVPDMPTTSVSALNGPTNARIAIAASKDRGFSFSNFFSPADTVDIAATIAVDERHVGMEGSMHVMVGEYGSDILYQINESGVLETWDGKLGSLVPIGQPRVLLAEERLQLLESFQFDESLIGRNLVIYVAYQVFLENDLVYTDSPLTFEIVDTSQ